MSIEALNWALEHMKSTPDMPTATKFVLMILANRTGDETGDCYPSIRYIRERTSLSESGIRAACKDLHQRGLLEITPRLRENNSKTSNLYRLRLEDPPPPITRGAPTPTEKGSHPQSVRVAPAVSGGQETKELDGFSLTGESRKALNGKIVKNVPILGNKQFGVTETYLKTLEEAYPNVDGPLTLNEIVAWCVSNPRKLKTEAGIKRFINAWFAKEQNGLVGRR